MPLSRPGERATGRGPILVTQGEPSGIGPEIALKSWIRLNGRLGERPIRLVGSVACFRDAAAQIGCDFAAVQDAVVDTGEMVAATAGRPSPKNARSVTSAIEQSVAACMAGSAAAIVTAPIQKSALTEAGFGFPGHTEYLASLTGRNRAVMMLASSNIDPPLRVIPLTIHIPLQEVVRVLNGSDIKDVARIVLSSLTADFGVTAPRLTIAGLNPHAGESGTIGREETEIIAPAISELRREGHRVEGPASADTLFHDSARRTYDAVICMFHDQALIPIKTLAFWSGVNATLGLPIVRTSPDHGTALDIAGRGVANETSMIAAIRMAAEIASRRGL